MDSTTIATLQAQAQRSPRGDRRDWRNVATDDRPKRTKRGPRRQGTRQAVLQAYAREGGY